MGNRLPALLLGAAIGASSASGAALLLYATRGFLGTAGFLIALTLATLAFGLWVGADERAPRRRWIGVIVAYVAAAIFAAVWRSDAAFRTTGFAGALAVFFFLAEPAYTTGAAFGTVARRSGPAAFLGAALGALAATHLLIPRLHPSVIFVGAAAVVGLAALLKSRRTIQMTDGAALSLNGKTAIVTGVSERGQVGFVVAQALRAAGARVCVTAMRESVHELAREIGAESVTADLTSDDDVARLIATAREKLGAIDILVNVAGGLSVIKPLADTSRAEWEREIQRNAETVFLVSRAALPQLRERKGAIINFASPAGMRAIPTLGAYSAAKAAVVAFTRALAIEEKGRVRVNAIAPGMIDTEQNRASVDDPESVQWVTREQIANVVLFLASEEASGVTGETIHVLANGIE